MATCRQVSTSSAPGLIPIATDARPGKKTLTVIAGHTYSYTAVWSGQNLALVSNQ